MIFFIYLFIFFEIFKSSVNVANVVYVINFKKLLSTQLNKGLFYFHCSLAPELFMTC